MVLFRDIGLRNERELFERSLRTHVRRAFNDLLQPLASVVVRRPQIVHVCVSSGSSFLVGLLYAGIGALLRIPTVVHVHGTFSHCSRRAVTMARRLAASSSVVFVTPSAADAQEFAFPVQISNFVPRLAEARTRRPRGNGLRLVYMGWMTRTKGIFELTEAVAGLTGVTLDLYGPVVRQAELAEWQALVERLNGAGSLQYRGMLDEAEVLQRLADYDALAVASYSESFGMAAAEAMMNGLPVISTRTGFLTSLSDDCFTPLPLGDSVGIRRVLEDVGARPDILGRKAEAAFRFASSQLSEDAAFARWISVYQSITARVRVESCTDTAGVTPGR